MMEFKDKNALDSLLGLEDETWMTEEKIDVIIKDFAEMFGKELKKDGCEPEMNSEDKELLDKFLPMEMYGDISLTERWDYYFQDLNKGDVLMLKVINVILPDEYKLLVVAKEGTFRKLDDLSLVVYLSKTPMELEKIGHPALQPLDLLKAVIYKCNFYSRKFYVTLDESMLKQGDKTKLGRISEKDLPYYVNIDKPNMCCLDYVKQLDSVFAFEWNLRLPSWFGLDKKIVTSLIPQNNKRYPPEQCASDLSKRQLEQSSNKNFGIGMKAYKDGDIKKAIEAFNIVIKRDPKNVEAYVRRGTLLANSEKFQLAVQDFTHALSLNQNHTKAQKHLSELLVVAGKTHREQKNYHDARKALEKAIEINPYNEEAISLLEKVLIDIKRNKSTSEKRKPGESSTRSSSRSLDQTSQEESSGSTDDEEGVLPDSDESQFRSYDTFMEALPSCSKSRSSSSHRQRKKTTYHRHHHRHRHHHEYKKRKHYRSRSPPAYR